MATKRISCHDCCGRGIVRKNEVSESADGSISVTSRPERCQRCSGKGFAEVPLTNIEMIRRMTDQQLAEFIATMMAGRDELMKYEYKKQAMIWLHKPAKEGKHEASR